MGVIFHAWAAGWIWGLIMSADKIVCTVCLHVRQPWPVLIRFSVISHKWLPTFRLRLTLVSLTQMLLLPRLFLLHLQPVHLANSELVVGRAVAVRTVPSVMQRPVIVAVLLDGREPSAPTVSLLPPLLYFSIWPPIHSIFIIVSSYVFRYGTTSRRAKAGVKLCSLTGIEQGISM